MSDNPIVGPWASGSYGTSGTFLGEIVSINDPLRRNRVQVRVHGYENDKGLIPDDKLSWYSVLSTSSSQLAGSSSTHSYYPGAKVLLTMAGTEMIVMGTTAGFDSDKRRNGSAPGSSEQPDTPRQVQGKGKEQSGARDGEGKDTTTPTSRDPKTDKPYQEPDEQDAYKDSRDKAPFKKGERAKKPDDKSIGNIKNTQGADILQMIKSMDGNASGAVRAGVDLIQKLRRSAFGTSQEMIGSGLMTQAAQQSASDFGAPPVLNLLPIAQELIECWKILAGATPRTIRSLALDGSLDRCASALSPPVLQVSESVIDSIIETSYSLSISNLSDNSPFLNTLKSEYTTGLNQAWAGITSFLNTTADQAGSAGGLIALFSDPQAFCDLSSILAQIGNSIGTSPAMLASIGRGAVEAALTGGPAGAHREASSSGGPAMQALSMIMNTFASNPVAQSEISGGINPQSLLQIPLKYAKKQTNDPLQKFTSMFGQVAGSLALNGGGGGNDSFSWGAGSTSNGSSNTITYDYVTTATISDYILPPATSSQATSGTGNNALMTPWSTAQAIAAAGGSSAGFQQRYLFTASAGQTTISGTDVNGLLLNYTPGYVELVINGIWLPPTDYTATSGSSITVSAGLSSGDTVYVYAISPFAAVNTYDKSQNGADVIDDQAFRANIGTAEKNYVINGAMMVSQENGTTAGTTAGYYPVDQFLIGALAGTTGAVSAAQAASKTPAGSPNRLRVTVTSADAASVPSNRNVNLSQAVEGLRVADLNSGTSSARTIVIRFGVRAPAGTYCVSLRNGATNRSYVAEYTISAGEANTDVVKSVLFALDTTGTWAADNTAGFWLNWALSIGSTLQTSAGSWTAGNYLASSNQFNFMATVGNVFELFDVGLYAGSTPPSFYVPDFASELALCKRYWEKSYDYSTAVGSNTPNGCTRVFRNATDTLATLNFSFCVEKRATPTVTAYSTVTGASGKFRDSYANVDVAATWTAVGTKSLTGYAFFTSTPTPRLEGHYTANARM